MLWSTHAWDEVFRNYAENNPDNAKRFRQSMQKNAIEELPECLATLGPYNPIGLIDKDDEPIAAAAIQCGAQYLLTNDAVFLGQGSLPGLRSLRLMPPDVFLISVPVANTPSSVQAAVEAHRASLTTTQPSKVSYCDSLNRAGLNQFSTWLTNTW